MRHNAISDTLLTAEAYAAMPDNGGPSELVRGKIVDVPHTTPRCGQICTEIIHALGMYIETHDLGHLVCNHSAVITQRNPDTVRGAHVAFYSYQRVSKGPLPWDYLPVAPDLVFEVLSPGDRWSDIHVKSAEYLDVAVRAVCVVDDETRSVHVFPLGQPIRVFKAADEFALPEILSEFRVKVERFFE
jgi:Uma2 family endonuclease